MLGPLDLIDHVLFAILAVGLGARAFFAFRRIRRASPQEREKARPRAYRTAMVTQWTLAAATIAHWTLARDWKAIGLEAQLTPGAIGVVLGLVVIAMVMILQNRRAGAREAALERARARIRHVEFILPHTPRELRLFIALSITAGICEELLYRGFLIWYLAHFMGLIQAAALASLLFGIGHFYQGARGVMLTGLVGVFMSAIYLVSGSLYAGMVLHALIDISSGRVGYTLLTRDAAGAGTPPETAPA